MSFVMIATGTTSRSRVRTLPARPLLLAGGLVALLLLAAGGAAGSGSPLHRNWCRPGPLRPRSRPPRCRSR